MPSTWLGVLLFLLLIAPGLLFDLLSDRRRAVVKESAFREVGRTILASLGFGAVGLAIASLAHVAWPAVFADPAALIGAGAATYLQDGAIHVAALITIQTSAALAAAGGANWYLQRRSHNARLRAVSAWFDVFRRERPEETVPYARVRTKSGVVWAGTVIEYSPDLEIADRELVLGTPLASSKTNAELKPLPSVWQRVLLRDDEIQWITVKYVPKGAHPEMPPSPRRS